jgi:hypothetical protein
MSMFHHATITSTRTLIINKAMHFDDVFDDVIARRSERDTTDVVPLRVEHRFDTSDVSSPSSNASLDEVELDCGLSSSPTQPLPMRGYRTIVRLRRFN